MHQNILSNHQKTFKSMTENNQKVPVEEHKNSEQESRFEHGRHITGGFLGPLLAILIWLIPIEGLTPEAHKLLSIVVLVAIWWITEPVPIPVTSLVGPTLCVVFGVVKMKEAFAAFANPMIFLFMGGFIIAKAMTVNVLFINEKMVGNTCCLLETGNAMSSVLLMLTIF